MWFWIFGWFFVTLAVVGNGVVIFLIITAPRLQTNSNWFVLSLAVADLFATLAYFPPLFGVNFLGFKFDTTHAGAFFKISFTLMYCSNTNLFVMTMDRYIAVTRPLRYVELVTKNAILGLITAAWATPFLLFSLPAIFTYDNNPGYTLFVESSRVAIFQIFPVVVFVLITWKLLRLAKKLSRQTSHLVAQIRFNHASAEVNAPRVQPAASKRGTSAMVVLIITAFNITYLGGNYRCVCWLTKVCPFEGNLRLIVYLTLIAKGAVNPIVYAFLKKDVQQELCKMLRLPDV